MAEAWLLTSWNDAGDAVIATDAEGRVAELNRAAARLTGWSAPEALGSPIAEVFRIVDGSTRRPIEDPAGRALSGGGTVGLADPTLLIDRSGMECPIEGSATAVRLGSGGFAGAVLVFRAVRGRRADLLPDQGEERLRLALTAARMVAWQWNPPDGSRRVSDNAPDVFGLPAGTTLLSIDQWLALLHPEDIEGYRQVYGRAIETRESYLTHYRLIRPDDGRVLWMEERGHAACDESGAMARLVGVVMDVTDARRAEDRLRIARSRLESTLSVGEIGTWEYDASRGVVTADRNLARIYGVTPEGTMEGPVDRFLDIIHPEDHERIIRGVGAALESGETYEAEYRLVLPDRSIRWVIARARVVRGDSGQDVRMPGVVVDITKLKRAEEALRETRSRLDSTLAAGEIGTWEFDPNADVVLADPNLARMFGVTPEEAAGGRIGTYLRAIHPDDRDRVAVAIGRSIEEGEGYEADYRLVAADGSIRWVVARGRVERDEDGRPRRLPGVVIDVTGQRKAEAELRASEERRRLALDTAELGAWNIDSATLVLRSDERFRMIVRGSAAPIAFEEAFAAIHPDDRDRVRHAVAAAMRADHPRPFAEEYRVIHPDRSTRWVFGKGRAHYEATAAGRRLASLDGTVADITDRKLGEQEREHLVGQLREQDLRKDDFLATLAHELRNPLAPIRNGLQILKVGGHDPPAVEEARVLMERQLTHMVRLIDDLMDVSRITRNKLELKPERATLDAIVRNAVETSRTLMESAGHSLSITLPARPIVLDADVTRLSQVFSNLLNNAAKYTDPGGKIALSAERHAGEVVVTVQDDGVGIPPEMLRDVFTMFTQVDRSLERSRGGLGIGLSLVKTLVEMHGGTVEAHSDGRGLGSRFAVRLPIVPTESDRPATPETRTRRPGAGLRILVVDDNQDSARTLARLLTLLGHRARTAFDGGEAVAMAEAEPPELILLDIGLPVMNGYDVARTIRGRPWGRDVRIVALTGWGQDGDRRRSREAGIDRHLVKPVAPEILEGLLAEARSGPSATPAT